MSLGSGPSHRQTCHSGAPKPGQLPQQWLLRGRPPPQGTHRAQLRGPSSGAGRGGGGGGCSTQNGKRLSKASAWNRTGHEVSRDYGTLLPSEGDPTFSRRPGRGLATSPGMCPPLQGTEQAWCSSQLFDAKTSSILDIKHSTSQLGAAGGYVAKGKASVSAGFY